MMGEQLILKIVRKMSVEQSKNLAWRGWGNHDNRIVTVLLQVLNPTTTTTQ
jgi:hypothetical protein